MERDPIVSICCTTYNHEKFIGDAIEGFLMQKTGYDYEILIGEDLSQDRTREIVRAYQAMHPDIIRVFENETNLRGRGNSMNLFAHARGKYIALCEGDDFWTDEQKLDRQVRIMEENPQCSMCFHAAKVISAGNIRLPIKVRPFKKDHWCSPSELIPLAGGGISTNSKVFRRSCFEESLEWYKTSHVGDMAQDLLFAQAGAVYYVDRYMSTYRLGARGSWTWRLYTGRDVLDKKVSLLERDVKLYESFDEYTKGRYQEDIDKICTRIGELKQLLKPAKKGEGWAVLRRMQRQHGLKTALFAAAKYGILRIYAKTLAPFLQ